MTDQQPHTPTKAEIMDSYRRGRVWATPNGGRTYAAEFERWYKKIIAAAEQRGAERERKDIAASLIDWDVMYGHEPADEETRIQHEIAAWIDNRADRIADRLEGDDE